MPLYAESDYLHDLLEKASQEKLHEKRYWNLLLHYKKTLFGWESEVDADSFFLAVDGKTDPKAELEETIRSIFLPKISEENNHPQCRFVARFKWLKEQLNLDQKKLPFQKCQLYNKWIASLQPESVSLIFPSYFLEQPASMFGHTLLRINSIKNDQHNLLNYTINYAAQIEDKDLNPISYIFKGIFGGFKGIFSLAPYYGMVINYNDIESRDIWEYNLSLTTPELTRMLNHLWEFQDVYFDYYFFKENCSYHLLSLLEIARPSLNLRATFNLWTIPVDSIKAVLTTNEILKDITYRPSRRRKMENSIKLLTPAEKDLIELILDKMTFDIDDEWNHLPEKRKYLILNIINHYCLLERSQKSMHLRDEILGAMSQLKLSEQVAAVDLIEKSPDLGHDSFLIAGGAGQSKLSGPFKSIVLRPSLHDILSNDTGYMPYGNIEFLKLEAHYYSKTKKYILNQFDILNITSLNPSNFISTSASWDLNIGIQSVQNTENEFDQIRFINSGVGLSYTIFDSAIYAMLGVSLLDGKPVSRGDHVTPLVKFGYLFSSADIFKTHFVIQKKYNKKGQLNVELGTAFYLGENHEFRLLYQNDDINNSDSNIEYQGQYRYFF